MPYIKQSRRDHFQTDIDKIYGSMLEIFNEKGFIDGEMTSGDLNYLITNLCLNYLYVNKECYQTYNDVIGALEGAKLELYRRKIAPYEDRKIDENGDVY